MKINYWLCRNHLQRLSDWPRQGILVTALGTRTTAPQEMLSWLECLNQPARSIDLPGADF